MYTRCRFRACCCPPVIAPANTVDLPSATFNPRRDRRRAGIKIPGVSRYRVNARELSFFSFSLSLFLSLCLLSTFFSRGVISSQMRRYNAAYNAKDKTIFVAVSLARSCKWVLKLEIHLFKHFFFFLLKLIHSLKYINFTFQFKAARNN